MKKLFLLLLINISFNPQNLVTAQSLSIAETKTILCSHKWLLQGLEENGKSIEIPELQRGYYWIFKSNGTMISFTPAFKGEEEDEATWYITENYLSTTEVKSKERNVFKYRLENLAGLKLIVTADADEENNKVSYIFKQAEKTGNVTTEKKQGRVELPAKKIEVTAGNYKLKEGDCTPFLEITMNSNELLLKGKDKIDGPIKYTASYKTVSDILNKYYYKGNVSDSYIEIVSTSKIIFYVKSKPCEFIKTTDETTLNYFDDFNSNNFLMYFDNTPQWRYLYTKGEKMGIQRKQQTKSFPEKEIQKDWLDGRYVTDISFGGPGDDKNWVLINSKNKFTDQLWRTADNSTDLEKTIVDVKNKNPDFYISHITYGDGKWVLIFSKGTRYSSQTTIISSTFPEADITKYGTQGLSITDLAYGGGKWVVCMSKDPELMGQHYVTLESWDQEKINKNAEKGYYVTETVKQDDKWRLVFSKDKNITSQKIDLSEKITAEQIQKRWQEGFDVSRIYYY